MKLAVEGSGLSIWEWHIPSNTVKYDPKWAEMLGYTYEEIQPMSTIWDKLVHPQDKPISVEALNQVIIGESTRLEIEQRMQNRSGEWRWFLSRGTIVEWSSNGKPIRFVGLDADITERKQNEVAAFQFELERQRIDVLATFMQSSKHEFKTPLSRINTKLYLMQRAKSEERRNAIAHEIEEQVAEIDYLVDSMMLMARLDTINKISTSPVDLRNILESLITEFDKTIEEKNIRFISNIPNEIPKLRGNTNDLYEAFYRIMDNAFLYTQPKGHVQLSVRVTRSNIIIEVQDTGVGIPDTILPHIFERFFREDKAHTTSGIGLGLPIAQRVFEQHKGTIRVSSMVDIGTTVQVRLPIRHI